MTEEPMPKNYRLLKGIVITLGILIVAMVILIITASIMKYNDQKSAEAALVDKYQSSQSIVSENIKPFKLDLPLEAGEEVLSVSSNDRGMLVSIGKEGRIQKILLIGYSGKILGTININ
ncbi:MAG: hypothetical protein KDF58_10190 [Alphaproteobacteria bacterium]|nr:hypothetical protein [Alphaproteobacteria bacterium]HPF46022.1 hypothetical protein [Emcibacteraceae bacterium]